VACAEVSRPLQVLDIATGAGDTPIRLLRQAQHEKLSIEIDGCDKSEQAVAYARRNAQRHGSAAHFFPLDILKDPLPGHYDVLMCSLFLHHLSETEARFFLRKIAVAARRLVLISDLQRSLGGLWLAAAAHLLTRSEVVYLDAPQSVRAAFTLPEAVGLAEEAGLRNFQIRPVWPFRYLLTGKIA
jgi:2-polyprenyl-3-methyl-5-hydroxy-6-metoxy-1,4-benzoquinol methylase